MVDISAALSAALGTAFLMLTGLVTDSLLYGGLGDLSAAAQSSEIFFRISRTADAPSGALGVLPAKNSWYVADGTAAVADSSADPPFADGYGGRRRISGGGIQSVRLCAGQLCHRGPSVYQRVFLRRYGKNVSALSEYQPAGSGGKRSHAVYRPFCRCFWCWLRQEPWSMPDITGP